MLPPQPWIKQHASCCCCRHPEQNNTSAVVAAVTLNKTTRQLLLLPSPWTKQHVSSCCCRHPEQNITSAVVAAATLNAPALSTQFQITRRSFHCRSSTVVTLIQWAGYRLEQRGNLARYQTGARDCSIVKSMQIETGIHKYFYSIGPVYKKL